MRAAVCTENGRLTDKRIAQHIQTSIFINIDIHTGQFFILYKCMWCFLIIDKYAWCFIIIDRTTYAWYILHNVCNSCYTY